MPKASVSEDLQTQLQGKEYNFFFNRNLKRALNIIAECRFVTVDVKYLQLRTL